MYKKIPSYTEVCQENYKLKEELVEAKKEIERWRGESRTTKQQHDFCYDEWKKCEKEVADLESSIALTRKINDNFMRKFNTHYSAQASCLKCSEEHLAVCQGKDKQIAIRDRAIELIKWECRPHDVKTQIKNCLQQAQSEIEGEK
jgi:predicted nuclease with TOPRIM domain